VFLGGVLNSGVLATGTSRHAKYNYSNAPPALLKRVRRLETVCARYRTLLHVAALRFPLAHLAVVTEVFGAQSVAEAAANIGPYECRFPAKYGLTCKVGVCCVPPHRSLKDRSAIQRSVHVRQSEPSVGFLRLLTAGIEPVNNGEWTDRQTEAEHHAKRSDSWRDVGPGHPRASGSPTIRC
jgi:hypothetical protein